MPFISRPILELANHIYLPIIKQTSYRLVDELALREVIGDQIYIDTDYTTFAGTSNQKHNVNITPRSMHVEASMQMNPSSQKWDAYSWHHTTAYGINTFNLNNHTPIYKDTKNQVRIIEMRSPVTIMLNCEVTLLTKEHGFAIPHEIFNRYENGACYALNDLWYDYPVPNPIVSMLHQFWKMDRTEGQAKGVPFVEYVQKNTDGKWQFRKHRELEEYELVVPCPVTGILGTMEYSDDKPQIDKSDRIAVAFTIPFVYTLQFASPTINILQFQAMYNNQVVPPKLIPHDTTIRLNPLVGNRVSPAHDNFMLTNRMDEGRNAFARPTQVPSYDEWVQPATGFHYHCHQDPFLITMLGVDEKNGKAADTVIDLLEPNPLYDLPPVTKEILYQQGSESVLGDTIYGIALYRNDKELIPLEDFTFDPEPMHLLFKAMDLHSQYRMVLAAGRDLYEISRKWWWLIDKYFPWMQECIQRQWCQWWKDTFGYPYDWNSRWGSDSDGHDGKWPPSLEDLLRQKGLLSEWLKGTGGLHAGIFQSRNTRYDIIARRPGIS